MATTQQCHEAMGAMMFAFQEMEAEFTSLLGNLIEIRGWQQFGIVCDKLTFADLLDVVGAVSQHKGLPVELVERLKKSLNKAAKLSEERNRYVHSYYDVMAWNFMGEVEIHRSNNKVSRRTGIRTDFEIYDPQKLRELAEQITSETLSLLGLHDEFKDHLFPEWREEPGDPSEVDIEQFKSKLFPFDSPENKKDDHR
jgi:hypothetical protein